MAEPEQGTYSIISVGSGKAVDVRGGSDKAGTNIQQYTYNKKADAQVCSIFVPKAGAGWQIYFSLTGMCMDIESGKVANGSNVRQWTDNNSNAQRFDIESTGDTYTFQGVSYPTYSIKVHDTNFAVSVKNNSTANSANIHLWSYMATNNFSKWIFVPRSPLMDDGLYEIISIGDTKLCMDVKGGSTANGADIWLYKRNESNAQKFLAHVDDETGLTVLENYQSNKAIDIKNGTAKNGQKIQQYTSNGTAAQKWLLIQNGFTTINTFNVPVYEIHARIGNGFVLDVVNGSKKIEERASIQLWSRNSTDQYKGQLFAFNKTERKATQTTPPGLIRIAGKSAEQTTFSYSGEIPITAEIPLDSLVFDRMAQTAFQARYRYRYVDEDRQPGNWSGYRNISDNPATNGKGARSGWGEAWTPSFESQFEVVTLPLCNTKLESDGETVTRTPLKFTLNDTNHVSAEIEIEVRSCGYNESNGDHWVTEASISTIKLAQIPDITVDPESGIKMIIDKSTGELGIEANLTTVPANVCERVYARLLDSDGAPISELASSSKVNLTYSALSFLHKIPLNGDSITLEYTMLTMDGLNISGRATGTFSYTESSVTDIGYSIEYSDDDSCTAIVTANTYPNIWCFMILSDIKGNRMVGCEVLESNANTTKWRIVPPINQLTTLLIIARDSNGRWIRFVDDSVYVGSHLFIWNWTDIGSSEVLNGYASIIVNSENAPKQDRKFTTDEKFNTPAGRVYPVAFSSNNISVDLSIEGVVIEDYADYQAFAPLPKHTSISHLRNLIGLSGNGIHPIYRTPYGDWFTVAIENIDLSKSELYYSSARITQRAVED